MEINELQKYFNDEDKSRCIIPNTIDDSDEADNIASLLPIKDTRQLESFEEKLKNKEFYKQVIYLLILWPFKKIIIF